MADYKRMVSYMYQYEDGVKKRNVGYARVEARNGQCKITLHMQLLGQNDSIFPIYLIHRNGGDMDLIYLGDSALKSQILDSKLTADEKNIMASGYGLSEVGGILLFLEEKVFFATEWDDKPIIAKVVLNALKPKKEEVYEPSKEDKPLDKTQSESDNLQPEYNPLRDDMWLEKEATGEEYNENRKKDEEPESWNESEEDGMKDKEPESWNKSEEDGMKDEESESWDKSEEDGMKDKGPESWNKSEEDKKGKESDNVKQKSKVQEYHRSKENYDRVLEEVDTTMPKYKLPRGWKIVERRNQAVESVEQIKKDNNKAEDLSAVQDSEFENMKKINTKHKEEEKKVEKEEKKEIPVNPLAARILENHPRINPFEDNEITMCVKIEPKDIGFLPMDSWILNNNSFLLHGYYSYRHLIFANIKDRFGCRYILGVPGIYHNRERFMARMFGFDNFKSIRKRELRQGDFGYWYLTINM